ncbi:S41 family peptidase [Patescibacteria group bacterium]
MNSKRQALYTVLAFFFVFMVGWYGGQYYLQEQGRTKFFTTNNGTTIVHDYDNPQSVDLGLFWNVWDKLEGSYLEEGRVQNDQNLIYGSIKGLVDSLDDPYTVFMTPDETKEFEQSLNGTLEGVGIEITVEEGLLIVISPLKDSPAEKAGILPGDIIFMIDSEIAADMTLFEAIMNIRGERGTPVTLTILRENVDEPFEVTITRDTINEESVYYELMEENIAYVAISQFSDNTTEEFDKTVQNILLEDPKGLIIDLRFNGGGYLDIAVDILSEFLDGEKVAVQIVTRDEELNETIQVWDDARLPKIPIVVLVNFGSASASEILAGAIQDHKRGLVIGEQTFGKGSVQEVEVLEDGSSLRLTIAKWLTPNGRDIEEVGIVPDRIIEIDYESEIDTQLQEAFDYLLNL